MSIFILNNIIRWLQASQLACPVKKYLHICCPGCGMQRSFVALLQGNFTLSVQYHAGTIPILFFFLYATLHLIFKFRHGNKIIVYGYIFVAAIILCNYIYKIITHSTT